MKVDLVEEHHVKEDTTNKSKEMENDVEANSCDRGGEYLPEEENEQKEVEIGEKDGEAIEDSKMEVGDDCSDNGEDYSGSSASEMCIEDGEQTSTSEIEDEKKSEELLTDGEIEELLAEFLEVESKAAEAQESLEEESLAKVESEVRSELAEKLQGDELEQAIKDEMEVFKEEWQSVLDDLENQSSILLEQLDGAGIELPSIYKWIESQAPNVCCTEAWKKRAHWVGSLVPNEVNDSIREAEKCLQVRRPVQRKHGRLLETGASGFLAKNLSIGHGDMQDENPEKGWSSFSEFLRSGQCSESNSFGSKNWAAVYLASTPQEAAKLGLKLPGVDEVEEIDELQGNTLYEEAIQNEKEIGMSEEQMRNYRKVREEDDVKITRKLNFRLKKKRRNKRLQEAVDINALDSASLLNGVHPDSKNAKATSGMANKINDDDSVANGKRKWSCENGFADVDTKRGRTVIIDSDDDDDDSAKLMDDNTSLDDLPKGQGSPIQFNKAADIIDVDVLPSPVSNIHPDAGKNSKRFCCTVCSEALKASEVHNHPIMKVIVCGDCRFLLVEKMRIEDSNSTPYCRWCGKCDELLSCNSCKELFCAGCILKNFGETHLFEVKTKGWECFCCSPHLLRRFILSSEQAHGNVPIATSGSDSELSDAVDVGASNKRRQKRRIRRILDDAELGEETKKKIAIEQARQEHLKSMQSHSATRMCTTDGTNNFSVAEVSISDDTEGYLVNVARENDEEPVSIPRSISTKLKPHQVAGIRFMWENIIQSVKKVKSGDKGLGCILAHTMGLGKTFQVIAFLYTAMRGVDLGLKTALIVTPVNVLHNWRQEFTKWQPKELKPLRVLMLEDASRERRAELLSKWRVKGGVLLIGYASFRNLSLGRGVKDINAATEICHSLHYGPDILVCDEAHMIKNRRADITQALRQVKTQRRIALTGSPLQNNLMEYYCMVDFVREGYLGSSQEFRNRFQNPIENGQHANSTMDDVKIMNQRSHILYEQLKGFVQRVDMGVVKKDLPSKTVFVITVKLSPLQRKLYRKFLDVHGFAGGRASSEKTFRRNCFFTGYQALAQIWNHPGLLQLVKDQKNCPRKEDAVENFLMEDSSSDDNLEHDFADGEKQRQAKDLLQKTTNSTPYNEETGWWEKLLDEKAYNEVDYSGKMVLLLDILRMGSEMGDKALVFSQSLTTLDLIELFLSKLPRNNRDGKFWKQGKDWYRLDGSTPASERQKLVERFNETTNQRVKCTLISTRAGSLGINLYAANRVIVVDGSWNPTYDLQAIFRAWRYGQKKPVYAYRLLAHGTMEEKIYKRQVTKEGLSARVVDRQQIYRTMSKEEILHLFDFGDDENFDVADENRKDHLLPVEKDAQAGHSVEKKLLPFSNGSTCLDKVMDALLRRHYPHWIVNYHEHETLLQENEAEKLSKEEQDSAWRSYQKSMEWEEVQRVVYYDREPKQYSKDTTAVNTVPQLPKSAKSRVANQRKCTNLAHLLTLRSKGIKSGSSTTCGDCAQEISWETLHKDGKSR